MLNNKYVKIALIILPLLGLVDASYLAVKHFAGEALQCSLLSGCEVVLTSKYSMIMGVPVAVLGALYYGAMFLLISYYFLTENKNLLAMFRIIVGIGMLMTIYFVSLQLFVIGSICQYCMISALVTTIMASIVGVSWVKSIKETKNKSYEI